ncbi:F-box protein [Quillaja saponaria]|uniref:F-box protein n=1 Tax=Quillaja saponaria TaxID=32244 RepID=A0AAD7Q896_QUISA|nr:F-box protein [Quillaja saponaria]
MFYVLISCVSLILLSKSFTNKPIPAGNTQMKLLSTWYWGKSSIASWFQKSKSVISLFPISLTMVSNKRILASKLENEEEEEEKKVSLLDLPELTLECILERLSPDGLCNMAAVCASLRGRCKSDHLWEKHMKQKWGELIGDSAYRQWQCHIASRKRPSLLDQCSRKSLFMDVNGFWPFLRIRSKSEKRRQSRSSFSDDSMKAWYLSLESGELWFPAQVYNRENGNAGFMLSCYDAQISYVSQTDTFQARYSPHGGWATEENIQWDRLRSPPIDIPSHDLYVSDCLDDLKPGDHIEIQWRRNKGFPYGWWYGIIGHLESCHGHGHYCCCHHGDMVILEFNQYNSGSRWRQTVINRKYHREEGNEIDGFYGGIRKLHNEEEIARWKNLWPTRIVE